MGVGEKIVKPRESFVMIVCVYAPTAWAPFGIKCKELNVYDSKKFSILKRGIGIESEKVCK